MTLIQRVHDFRTRPPDYRFKWHFYIILILSAVVLQWFFQLTWDIIYYGSPNLTWQGLFITLGAALTIIIVSLFGIYRAKRLIRGVEQGSVRIREFDY